jgi:hypothetical protein
MCILSKKNKIVNDVHMMKNAENELQKKMIPSFLVNTSESDRESILCSIIKYKK